MSAAELTPLGLALCALVAAVFVLIARRIPPDKGAPQ